MSTNTDGGTYASLSNTPQAKDDYYALQEDQVACLDVMANDLGGNAKVLWSIDTTSDDGATDLATKDVVGCVDNSELGASISLTADSKILYDSRTSAIITALAYGETRCDQFTYAIRLSNGTLSWATVNVLITGTNDAPDISVGAADKDSAAIDETNAPLSACGTLTVTDPDTSDKVNIGVTSVGVSGTGTTSVSNADLKAMLSLTGNTDNEADGTAGSLHWAFNSTPQAFDSLAAGETLILTYTLTASDGHGGTDTQTVTVTINGTNDAPVVSGAVTGNATEDGASSTLNALANASDVDHGAVLSVVNVPAPASLPAGVSYDALTHSFTLDPDDAAYDHLAAGATTTVTVNYGVSDGTATTPASVTWTVTGTNDTPVVSSPIADQSSLEDAAFNFFVPAGSFTDVDDGTTLVYSATLENGDPLPSWLTFNAATQTFSGTPPANFNGAFDVTVTASDGTLSASDTFHLTITPVNDAPAGSDGAVTTLEDTAKVLVAGDFGFSDPNDSPANALAAVVITSLPGSGTLTLDGVAVTAGQSVSAADIAAGKLVYTPAANATADASFTFQVQDNGGVANGGVDLDQSANTLTVHITPVNDAPVNQVPGAQTINEDAVLTFSTGNSNAISVSDGDLGGGNLTVTVSVAHGTLSLSGTSGLVFGTGDGTGDATMTFTGTQSAVNAALQGLTYTPTGDYNGSDTLTVTSNDNGNIGSGGAQQDSDTVAVTINVVSDIVADSVGVNANSGANNLNLLANDTFENPARFISAVGTAGHGTVTINDNGTVGNTADDFVVYTPNAGYSGSDSFSYTVTSGGVTETANVAVTVNAPANAAPTANNDSWVLSDATLLPAGTITPEWFLNNDTDPDSPSLYVTNVTGLPAGLTANYDASGHLVSITGTTPAAGTFALTYTMTDGSTPKTATVSVTVLDTTSNADNFTLEGNDYSYVDLLSGGDTITGDVSLTGPIITGNAGKDIFVGNNGTDTLNGGAGDDQLFGNENDDKLNGDAGNDILDGGNNNDTLNGGLGNDTLTGGASNDLFVFNTTLNASTNVDQITDFDANNNDKIDLDDAIFAGIANLSGTLNPADFVANAGGNATTATQNILYDTTTGNLYYDADGSGSGTKVLFAHLTVTGGTVDASDFIVI